MWKPAVDSVSRWLCGRSVGFQGRGWHFFRPAKTASSPITQADRVANQQMLNITMDIARGMAAFSVVMFHFQGFASAYPPIARLFSLGNYGVPLFFVISGYSISASAHEFILRNKSPHDFLRKRLLRIYPPFIASIGLIAALPYALALLSFFKTGTFVAPAPRWLDWTLADWVQLVTMTKLLFNPGNLESPFSPINVVYWTLTIELQFYLVIYACLIFRNRYQQIVSILTCVGFAAMFVPRAVETGFFIAFWPMFAVGIVLYNGVRSHGAALATISVGPIGAAAILVTAGASLAIAASTIAPLGLGFAPSYFVFSLVCAATLFLTLPAERWMAEQLARNPGPRNLLIRGGVFLGSISYSLYLLHSKIYQIPDTILRQVISKDSVLYSPLIIVGTIIASWAFSVLFEKPFLSRRNKPARSQ